MKSLANIKLGKYLSICNLGKCFVNQREQVLVFFYKAIKLIVVYAEAQAAVRLSYKEHKRGKERAARHNKPFVKVF